MISAAGSGQSSPASNSVDELERDVDQAIALCGGDMRAALRAMLLAGAGACFLGGVAFLLAGNVAKQLGWKFDVAGKAWDWWLTLVGWCLLFHLVLLQ